MTKTEENLRLHFPPLLVESIVEKLQQAYELNYERFDPENGDDAQLFGLMVYKTKVHLLSQIAQEVEAVRLLHKTPSFSLAVGPYRVSAYRAGDNGDVEIEEAFPRNKTRAPRLVEKNLRQLKLPFAGIDEYDDSECSEVIICDVGNYTDGLLKIFLAVPIQKSIDDRIIKWGTTVLLWENGSMSSLSSLVTSENLPPVEEAKPVTVTLKENTDSERKTEQK